MILRASPLRAVGLSFALACGFSAPAQDAPALPESFDPQAIDAFLTAHQKAKGPIGLSVALIKDGQLVLAKGYGQRSMEESLPVQTNTLFAIGSVTKQFTCACILLLAEDGVLSVQDKVAKYYPKLTRSKDITLLDLMNHTSGYRDYYPLDFVDRPMQRPIAPDDLLAKFAGGPLDFEPGTQWSYSNTGYILLGRIVENVTGQSFGDYLNKRILQPLGMRDTLYEPSLKSDRLAKGYLAFALGPPEPNQPEGKGWIGAAGGIWSTPTDLAKWDLALMNGTVLKPDSYRLMTTARELAGGKLTDYGCGMLSRIQNSRRVLSHTGAVSGFATLNALVPSTRSAVIMTCNDDEGMGSLPNQVLSLLLKERTLLPNIDGPSATEVAKKVLSQMQEGKPDRKLFSEEFNHYLSEARVTGAAERLSPYGTPDKVELVRASERGGMEVSVTRLTFLKGALRVLMYRRPDGIIEQFFVSKD